MPRTARKRHADRQKILHLVPTARTNLVNSDGKVLGIAGLGRNIDQPSEEIEANRSSVVCPVVLAS